MKITAQVVVINKEGLILSVSRKTNHNDFGLPGGKAEDEDNGDPMVTAYRETLEETGIKTFNYRLVLAIHKDGYMSYTYLADYEGEINHNEPHVVAWMPLERLVKGSFGKYNKLVAESLTDMGIQYIYDIPLEPIREEVRAYVDNTPYDGYQYKMEALVKGQNWLGGDVLVIYLDGNYEDLEETLGFDKKFDEGLKVISDKYGVNIRLNSDYYSK